MGGGGGGRGGEGGVNLMRGCPDTSTLAIHDEPSRPYTTWHLVSLSLLMHSNTHRLPTINHQAGLGPTGARGGEGEGEAGGMVGERLERRARGVAREGEWGRVRGRLG